jgi:glycogen(starch) synthase
MRHLLICREYPPASYPAGGIGTYAHHIVRLLAAQGETVHVIGERWRGAPSGVEEHYGGRLVIHRLELEVAPDDRGPGAREARALFATSFPSQAFAWRAGLLAERLVTEEGIDLIEGQDWEAPLYYFQLRRALGLGPSRLPPCVVHLHSPTESIVLHNEWDPGRPAYLLAKRLEGHTIAAADAWLCPSRFLARTAEVRYGLSDGRVQVIPLPIGGTKVLERPEQVWRDGSVLYVGRLEPRKGVLEWLAAALEVAARRRDVRFEFVGTDLPLGPTLKRLIPRELERRFVFHGEQPRRELSRFMSGARIAVVPSRWENFPNTCIEAMGSGLPVLATRAGDMGEIIEDGVSGWLVDRADPVALATALERALTTPPEKLLTMGREAATSIGRLCDNSAITEAHLRFRRSVVKAGPRPAVVTSVRDRTLPDAGVVEHGLAVILWRREATSSWDQCVVGLATQTTPPLLVVLVGSALDSATMERLSAQVRAPVMTVIATSGSSPRSAGVNAVRRSGRRPLGYVFLEDGDRPEPDLLSAYQRALERCPGAGVVSCWGTHPDSSLIGPCADLPYQLLANEAGTCVAVRAAAFDAAGEIAADLPAGYDLWATINAILAAGWSAVTYPALLVASPNTADQASDRSRAHWQAWPRVLERSREELTRHAVILLVLLGSERDRMERQMSQLQAEHGGGTTNPSWRQLLRMVLRAMAGRRGRAAWRRIRWTSWTVGHALRRVISTPPTEP